MILGAIIYIISNKISEICRLKSSPYVSPQETRDPKMVLVSLDPRHSMPYWILRRPIDGGALFSSRFLCGTLQHLEPCENKGTHQELHRHLLQIEQLYSPWPSPSSPTSNLELQLVSTVQQNPMCQSHLKAIQHYLF